MAGVPEGENCFAHHTLPVGKKLDSLSSLFERTENGTLYRIQVDRNNRYDPVPNRYTIHLPTPHVLSVY